MSQAATLQVDINLDEDDEHTDARATVHLRDREFIGRGRARRNPTDPNVPVVGEELAVARALAELSHQLVAAAADAIEGFVGHPVTLQE
jgi:Rv2632c-like